MRVEPSASLLDRIVEVGRLRWGPGPPAPRARERPRSSIGVDRSAFLAAITGRRGRAIIAEVKLGSPRLGDLRDRIDPEKVARAYARNDAAALSVVVEEDFFFGSYELARRCRDASGLPLLAKDFLVSERQLDRAVEAGASAVLLIVRLYRPEELLAWADAARDRGLVPLLELHEAAELKRLAGAQWEAVGVNQRDLATFDVSRQRALALRPALPADCLAVAESGIRTRADLLALAAGGYDGFLIGESLLLSADPGRKLRELLGSDV